MHLFGYGRIMQAVGPGMHGLGQIRLFFEGEVLVYCCPFRDIQKYLMTLIPAADGGHSVVGLPAVRRWAAGATQEALEASARTAMCFSSDSTRSRQRFCAFLVGGFASRRSGGAPKSPIK